MSRLVINSGGLEGLGTLYKVDSSGDVIDCDSFNNIFQSVCWNPFQSTVQVATPPASSVTATDGGSTVLQPVQPLTAADVTTLSPLCNFLDCDANGNLMFDTTNMFWFAGAAVGLLFILPRLLK